MTRKICSVILMLAMLAAGWIPSAAEGQEPIPIQFRKAGGGQFLYCNNPEFVKAGDLSTDENPQATYLMKNEGLKPGSYSDRKSTRLNSSHDRQSRMPSSA